MYHDSSRTNNAFCACVLRTSRRRRTAAVPSPPLAKPNVYVGPYPTGAAPPPQPYGGPDYYAAQPPPAYGQPYYNGAAYPATTAGFREVDLTDDGKQGKPPAAAV